ncbi:MAG: hypothetical protein PHW69_00495 [Elusimicrobiaceae bacterium]|nr:hypothetical protein [Elusimicrobiaceae bacterium]
MDGSVILGAWLAAGLTLFVYSFLYRENPLFRIAEHLYLGISVGYYFSVMLFNVWVPKVQEPLLLGDLTPLVPAVLGLTLLARLNRRRAWLSRFGFAFIMGYGAGVAIPAVLATMLLKQLQGALTPLLLIGPGGGPDWSGAALWRAFSLLVMAAGTASVVFYFFFSAEHKGPVARRVPAVGICFLMVYLGASFGVTVMSRFSLLYGRFSDLYVYGGRSYGCATFALAAAVTGFLAYYYGRGKKEQNG